MLGDGIGAEVAESVKTVFKAENVPVEWEQIDVSGVDTGDKHSEELFRESIASLKRNKIGLKGKAILRYATAELTQPRDPSYTCVPVRSPVLQRCVTARARYIRINCPHQEHPRLQNPPRQCGSLHHP